MSDTPTLLGVALGAIALGAGAVKLAQMALRRENKTPRELTAGQIGVEVWEKKIAEIVSRNSNDKILPLLTELKEIAQQQVEIQRKQNEILVELVTASRIGRRGA